MVLFSQRSVASIIRNYCLAPHGPPRSRTLHLAEPLALRLRTVFQFQSYCIQPAAYPTTFRHVIGRESDIASLSDHLFLGSCSQWRVSNRPSTWTRWTSLARVSMFKVKPDDFIMLISGGT